MGHVGRTEEPGCSEALRYGTTLYDGDPVHLAHSDGTVRVVSSVGCWHVGDCQRLRGGKPPGDRGASRQLTVVPGSFSRVSSWHGTVAGVGDEVHLARAAGAVLLVISAGRRLADDCHRRPFPYDSRHAERWHQRCDTAQCASVRKSGPSEQMHRTHLRSGVSFSSSSFEAVSFRWPCPRSWILFGRASGGTRGSFCGMVDLTSRRVWRRWRVT